VTRVPALRPPFDGITVTAKRIVPKGMASLTGAHSAQVQKTIILIDVFALPRDLSSPGTESVQAEPALWQLLLAHLSRTLSI